MNKIREYKILRYIKRVNTDADPVSIQAAITDYCFNKCHMCDHHLRSNKIFIPAEQWINFLKARTEIESVCYAGGDMMTHPKVNSIMKYHIASKKSFSFITCGYIPPSVSLNLLKKARWIRVSLDSINSEIYTDCRGGIQLSKILHSIDKAVAVGVNVELTITVSEKTKKDLPNLLKYAMLNGFDADIHPVYGSSFKELQIEELIELWVDYFYSKGLILAPYYHGNIKFKKCNASYYQIYIDSLGNIYPCCTMGGDTELAARMKPLGNISNWNNFLKKRKIFSNSNMLPKECNYCIDRFGEINQIVDKMNCDKYNSFF